MKINSNTILLESNDYKELEGIVEKIASVNNINDVDSIQIQLKKDSGIIKFSAMRQYKQQEIAADAAADESELEGINPIKEHIKIKPKEKNLIVRNLNTQWESEKSTPRKNWKHRTKSPAPFGNRETIEESLAV